MRSELVVLERCNISGHRFLHPHLFATYIAEHYIGFNINYACGFEFLVLLKPVFQ